MDASGGRAMAESKNICGAAAGTVAESQAATYSRGMENSGAGWGMRVLALGAVWVGCVNLVWRQPGAWPRTFPLAYLPEGVVLGLFVAVAAVELGGGLALLAPARMDRLLQTGAGALCAAYGVITALTLPAIVRHPLIFATWGGTGEKLSRLAGAAIVIALLRRRQALAWFWIFGLCVATFAGEQLAFFARTMTLVPTWIPPSPWFWTVVTTIAFGLAAAAMLAGRRALLAARLLTVMMVSFVPLIWIPLLIAQPHTLGNWLEGAETLSIAGACWVSADYLGGQTAKRKSSAAAD